MPSQGAYSFSNYIFWFIRLSLTRTRVAHPRMELQLKRDVMPRSSTVASAQVASEGPGSWCPQLLQLWIEGTRSELCDAWTRSPAQGDCRGSCRRRLWIVTTWVITI